MTSTSRSSCSRGWLHDGGQPLLALPALGSALWDPDTTPHVSDARLGNEALLEAIRELSFVEGGRRPVDFRNLGAEELGSVYESLLELHPAIDRETARFALTTAAGHERKQTGSYYTPTSLIGSLLETALDPVIDTAVQERRSRTGTPGSHCVRPRVRLGPLPPCRRQPDRQAARRESASRSRASPRERSDMRCAMSFRAASMASM